MKPRATAACVASLLALLAGCAATRSQGPAKAVSASPPPAAEPRRRQTIAVYPFDNNAVTARERLDFLRGWLPDVVGDALQESGELRLVERRALLAILQEQKLGASTLASREGRLQLGKMAGAQTLVFGGFTAIADTLQIDARIVDAESGLVLKSASVRGGIGEARPLGERIAAAVAKDLGVAIARRATSAGLANDQGLHAAELFFQGVALEKQGEKEEAIERFRQVLEIDRNDDEARSRLKRLLSPSR